MIVMSRFPVLAGIINHVVFEPDAALLVLVAELEVVKRFPAFGRLQLLLPGRLQIAKCFRMQFVCVDGLRRSDRISGEKDSRRLQQPEKRRSRAKLAKEWFHFSRIWRASLNRNCAWVKSG